MRIKSLLAISVALSGMIAACGNDSATGQLPVDPTQVQGQAGFSGSTAGAAGHAAVPLGGGSGQSVIPPLVPPITTAGISGSAGRAGTGGVAGIAGSNIAGIGGGQAGSGVNLGGGGVAGTPPAPVTPPAPPPPPPPPSDPWVGVKAFSVGSDDKVGEVYLAIDSNQRIYISGNTFIAPDGRTIYPSTTDVFVKRYLPSGLENGTVSLGSASGDDVGQSVVADSSGNIYVSGYTNGDLTGAVNPSSENRFFIAKLGTSGVVQWLRTINVGDFPHGENHPSLAVDASGNVYAVGVASISLDEGAFGALTSPQIFTVRYNSQGERTWIKQYGYLDQGPIGPVVDPSGSVYISTRTYEGITIPTTPSDTTPIPGPNIAIMKLNPLNGIVLWRQTLGNSPQSDYPIALTADNLGNIFLGGATSGNLTSDPRATVNGPMDAFIAKYDGSGRLQGVFEFGSSGLDAVTALVVDPQGNLCVGGITTADLFSHNLAPASAPDDEKFDIFLVKFDSSLRQIWRSQFGSPAQDLLNSIIADSQGNLYLAGSTLGQLSVNPGPQDHVFIMKYNSAGARQ